MTLNTKNRARKLLPVDKAESIAVISARETRGLQPTEEELLRLMSKSCPEVQTDSGPAYLLSDFTNFIKNLKQAILSRDSSYLRQQRGPRVDRIVDVEEFCESSEYMNQRGTIRPVVLEGLIELFDSERGMFYIECVLTGAIGWGKTFFSYDALAYMIYYLSCFHNPQLELGLAPGSSIVLIQQSQRYELAKKVVFEQFAQILALSPYFQKQFKPDASLRSELRFPSNISVFPVGGSDTAVLGMNVFGGVIDEMNFMLRTRSSERMVNVAEHKDEYDHAERVYTTLIRRMKSRFIQKGGVLPGKLLLISSSNYEGDFTDRKLKEAKTSKHILALHHTQWEALPQDRFTGEVFLVEIGNEAKQSRIIKSEDEARDKMDIIRVPVEYRTDFERDIDAALRDYAGYTAGVANPFIPYRELILKAQTEYEAAHGKESLFTVPEAVIDEVVDPDYPEWDRLVNRTYLNDHILTREQVFAVHVDAAVSEDAAGVAIGRIIGYKLLPSSKVFDPRLKTFIEVRDMRAPIYMIDGVLRIRPPRFGRQIDLNLVRDLVLWLRGELFVKWATMDSYQSAMMIQAFRKANMRAGVLSIDASIEPYAEVKSAIKDERILFPKHATLARELRELEKEKGKDKVDHPAKGSKDCADAVAGVVHILHKKEAELGTGRGHRRRVVHVPSGHEIQEAVQQEGEIDLTLQKRMARRMRVVRVQQRGR